MFTRYTIPVNLIKRGFNSRLGAVPKQKNIYSQDLLWKTIENRTIESPKDWKAVRNQVLEASGPRGQIQEVNIDSMTVGVCTSKKRYDLAWSYLEFLHSENIKPNLALMGKYFKLLYIKGSTERLSREDENRIIALYNNVRETYPVLDSLTLDNIIPALSITKNWRHCSDLLEEVKATARITAMSYSSVISAAFVNNEDSLAWQLLDEMLKNEKTPLATVFITYFGRVGNSKNKQLAFEEIEKMLYFLQQNNLNLENDAVSVLVEVCKKNQVTIRPTSITYRGSCKLCRRNLQNFELSHQEFNDLKTNLIRSVIVGKDVFNKTTPDELDKFKKFIRNIDNFDVVIDGLNVAYAAGVRQSPLVMSSLVTAVVSHFVFQKKKVLVIGRNHMSKWPRQNWKYLNENATIFLTQNLSQDDPYLLYCALHSGKNTIIVSKDLMRGHKFLLRELRLKSLFERWLSQRQYQLIRVNEAGKPLFKVPKCYSVIPQKNGDFWHIPYTTVDNDISWLCKNC